MLLLDILIFQDSLVGIKLTLEDTLLFTDSVSSNVSLLSIADQLVFTDTLRATLPTPLNDLLAFTDTIVTRRLLLNITDQLQFSDVLKVSESLADKLTFVDIITATKALGLSDFLALNDYIALTSTPLVRLVDNLVFDDRLYSLSPLAPETTGVTFIDSAGHQVLLDNPKFGNTNTIDFKRVNRTSRGNDLIIKGYRAWKPTFLQRFEWDFVRPLAWHQIQQFVTRNVGLPVTVIGLYAETRKVLLLKPDVEFSQVGVENYTLILDMQETQ